MQVCATVRGQPLAPLSLSVRDILEGSEEAAGLLPFLLTDLELGAAPVSQLRLHAVPRDGRARVALPTAAAAAAGAGAAGGTRRRLARELAGFCALELSVLDDGPA